MEKKKYALDLMHEDDPHEQIRYVYCEEFPKIGETIFFKLENYLVKRVIRELEPKGKDGNLEEGVKVIAKREIF